MRLVHLVPPPLHRLACRVGHRLRRLRLAWPGATIEGCSVVARDEAGRILLVRHSYGADVWTFPGGGLRRHETPLAAAMREFREELGCGLVDVRRLATIREPFLGAINIAHIYTGRVDGAPRADRREIVEARFFARDSLPEPLSRAVAPRMAALDAADAEAPEWHKLQRR